MKRFRRIFPIAGGLFLLIFLCRGPVFRLLVHYKAEKILSSEGMLVASGKMGKEIFGREANLRQNLNEETLETQKLVAEMLKFRLGNGHGSDLEKVAEGGAADCVGYAALAAAGLRTIQLRNHSSGYKVLHVRGRIFFLGIEITAIPGCPAWMQDHDFVQVIDPTKNEYLFDPVLYDYLGISNLK